MEPKQSKLVPFSTFNFVSNAKIPHRVVSSMQFFKSWKIAFFDDFPTLGAVWNFRPIKFDGQIFAAKSALNPKWESGVT